MAILAACVVGSVAKLDLEETAICENDRLSVRASRWHSSDTVAKVVSIKGFAELMLISLSFANLSREAINPSGFNLFQQFPDVCWKVCFTYAGSPETQAEQAPPSDWFTGIEAPAVRQELPCMMWPAVLGSQRPTQA
jgi:hypothetical protein